MIDVGVSSETATDLTAEENHPHLAAHGFPRPLVSQRLDRTLAVTRPDLLIVCYGMNDGSSLPNTDESTDRFAAAVTRLRTAALAAGTKRVVLCTPPIHDAGPGPAAPDPHEDNLVRFTAWLVAQRDNGWDVVDIHGPMRRDLDTIRRTDPDFRFQPDGVHPDRRGHWVMAREILSQFFGADLAGVTAAEQLFAANGAAIRAEVHQRRERLLSAYLTVIGHQRPGVPGGPGEPPGPSIAEAETDARTIGHTIARLQHPANG